MTKKDKAKAALARAKAAGKYALSGAKGSATAVGSGAAAYYAAKIASEHVETLRSRWWAVPAALAAGGHFAKKKNVALGAGLLGAAGYAAAIGYEMQKATAAASGESSGGQAQGPGPGAWADDGADAGRVMGGDASGPADRGAPDDGAPQAQGFEDVDADVRSEAYDMVA